jgi:hypothetical protein
VSRQAAGRSENCKLLPVCLHARLARMLPPTSCLPACLPACLAPCLQVSWLGAWMLLLGFRDFKTIEDMESGLPCLRPEEADMLGVVRLWARISAAAEVRCRCC